MSCPINIYFEGEFNHITQVENVFLLSPWKHLNYDKELRWKVWKTSLRVKHIEWPKVEEI